MNRSDFETAFFIAVRSIRRGQRSTFALLVFVLSLSFLNLMFISGILSGLTEGIMRALVDSSSAHISVGPEQEPVRKNFVEGAWQLRAQIATVPGVVGSARHYQLGSTITYDREKNGRTKVVSAPILGIDPEEEKKILNVYKYIDKGAFLDGVKRDEIVLSSGIAGGYDLPLDTDLGGVVVGDKVQVTYSNGIQRRYTIKGVFNVPVGTVAITAFISAEEAESILSVHDSASEILVRADTVRSTLDDIATRIRSFAPNLVVRKYTDRLAAMKPLLDAFDLISYIVSAISIAVATVTIFVLIYVNAVNKRRQIGILKAIGIKEQIIELSYVFQSFFYATLGAMIGSAFVFFVLVPLLRTYPIRLSFGNVELAYSTVRVAVSVASLLLAGIFAGFLPARIVAKEKILSAIGR